jgi:hypothetical protein
MRISTSASFLLCTVAATSVVGVAATARAQAAPPPSAVSGSGGGGSSGAGAGIGVGASAFINGPLGAQVVYDMPAWQIEGLLGFENSPAGMNQRVTTFQIGVSGWYHLHAGASSDFSVGGGFGIVTQSRGGGTAEVLEPGVQARVWVTPNVALHAIVGFPLEFGDAVAPATNSFGLSGQLVGGFGFTYFFR